MRSSTSRAVIAVAGLAALALCACSSTTVTDRDPYQGKRLARPDRILVYDFAATAAELPEWSEARDRYAARDQARTDEEIAAGRRLGSQVAADLVAKIRAMGLPAVAAAGQPAARLGDIALVGYLESIEAGGATIGVGRGAAELRTRIEGYRLTDSGMRRIGAANLAASGDDSGLLAPLAASITTPNPVGASADAALEQTAKRTADAIAAELRAAFARQGWI